MQRRVKPELFTDKEANELARVVAGGDAAAMKVQFNKVFDACKACHDKYRKEEK